MINVVWVFHLFHNFAYSSFHTGPFSANLTDFSAMILITVQVCFICKADVNKSSKTLFAYSITLKHILQFSDFIVKTVTSIKSRNNGRKKLSVAAARFKNSLCSLLT